MSRLHPPRRDTPAPPIAIVVIPTITNVVATSLSDTSEQISWDVSDFATGQVEYGLTTSYGQLSTLEPSFLYGGGATSPDHIQTLTGLTPATTYHYRVHSVLQGGGGAYSTDGTFTTSGAASSITYTPYTIPTGAGWTDGSDARANILAILNAHKTGGSTTAHNQFIFQSGFTYTISSGLALGGFTHCTFYLAGATIKCTGNGTSQTNSVFYFTGGNDDIKVMGSVTSSGVLQGSNTQGGTTHPYTAQQQYSSGVNNTGVGTNFEVAYLTIRDVWGHGIHLTRSDPSVLHQAGTWDIHDVTFLRVGVMGIAFAVCENITVRSCLFQETGLYPLNWEDGTPGVQPASPVTVSDCTIDGFGWGSSVDGPRANPPRAVTDSSASGIINGVTLRRLHFIGGARSDAMIYSDRWIHFVLGSGKSNIVIDSCDSTVAKDGEMVIVYNTVNLSMTNCSFKGVAGGVTDVALVQSGNSGTIVNSGNVIT